MFLLLEDLDDSGYSIRRSSGQIRWNDLQNCIRWLAHFHATFLGVKPDGLWKNGTYWHLDTRPDELLAIKDTELGRSASLIDEKLNNCKFKTLLHGDAKLANFCFSCSGTQVGAVDFQYVGGGCGMKDLAYFIGSCLDENDCERHAAQLLDSYFQSLQNAVGNMESKVFSEIESEWRSLFPFAWTDFHRFLKGWSPGHRKINSYSERLAQQIISSFQ